MRIFDFCHHIFRRLRPFGRNHGDFKRRVRYEVSLTNLASLQTSLRWRGSAASLSIAGACAIVAIGAIAIAVVNFTPLRGLLPAKLPSALRDDYEALEMRLDSLSSAANASGAFSENIVRILRGDSDGSNPDSTMAQASTLPLDSLLEASDAERAYVQRFEDEDRYELSVLAPVAASGMTFYPPVASLEPESRIAENGIPYTLFSNPGRTGVAAAYRGTVVNAYYSADRGITVSVQHPNDFITIYSGLANAFVSRGDKVKAGMRIGESLGANRPITFEIWHNGTPLQAEEYVNF